jgi:flavin reductase (DIM6/NTAB) family NADH-FMN oxidoreductase RutF
MEKIKLNGGTLLAPLPTVMVSCGNEEAANIITIGWTGILNTHPAKTYISVRPGRFSHHIIKESGEFVLNLTPSSLVRAADFCGMYTGAKVDKFAKCKLSRQFVEEVSAPLIAECPVSLCCRVTDVVPLGTHDMFVADIVAVYVDESLMDDKGKLHMNRADLCAYAHGEYFALGRRIGGFGFSAKKKSPKGQPQKKK